jgi:large conductance mechanosensitive channel
VLKEFRDFALKGNVLDLAVGVIIGAAFSSVVTSLVNDLLMPPIGKLTGNVDFKDLFVSLNGKTYASLAAARATGAPVLAYGQFLNTVLNFLIVSIVIFLLVKQITRFQKLTAMTGAGPSTKKCRFCATLIPVEALRCPHCTSELPFGSPAISAREPNGARSSSTKLSSS